MLNKEMEDIKNSQIKLQRQKFPVDEIMSEMKNTVDSYYFGSQDEQSCYKH